MLNCNLDLTSASQNTVPMVTDTLMDRVGSVSITIDANIKTFTGTLTLRVNTI